MAGGYIKLHRDIMDHWIWSGDDAEPFTRGQAWIDLLLLANYKDGKGLYGGDLRVFEAGTVHQSISRLAARWKWDRHKVRKFLTLLEADDMIRRTSNNQGTVIKIVNYAQWQATADSPAGSIGKPTKKPSDSAATSPATSPATPHIKENKEIKKDITPPPPPAGGRRRRMPRSEEEVEYDHTALIEETMI